MSKKKTTIKENNILKKDVFFIERKILDYFKKSVGDTYKNEIKKENGNKRN